MCFMGASSSMKKLIKLNKKGFTLIEVVASITILAIILTVCMNTFVFSNKTAVSNNEELVAIHLAKGMLERIKANPSNFIEKTGENTYKLKDLSAEDKEVTINDRDYQFNISINNNNTVKKGKSGGSDTIDIHSIGLVNMKIDVSLKSSDKVLSSIEGYVDYEE